MAIPFSFTLRLHEQSRAPSLDRGYSVLRSQAVLWTPPTPVMACGAFVSLCASVGGLPTAVTGLPCCTVFPPQHATPATPGVSRRHFRYFSTHPAAFPFRPEGRLLHLCY